MGETMIVNYLLSSNLLIMSMLDSIILDLKLDCLHLVSILGNDVTFYSIPLI